MANSAVAIEKRNQEVDKLYFLINRRDWDLARKQYNYCTSQEWLSSKEKDEIIMDLLSVY